MRKLGSATVLAILAAGGVQAGGIERIAPSTSILFEEGNYLELGWGYLSPDVSGEVITTVPQLGLVTGSKSGDMMGSYSLPSIAYKHDFGRGFSGALIYNQPYGANTLYDQADPDYFANLFGGQSAAHLSTNALTAILKYTTDSNISVYGGLRYQTMKASASVDFVGGYSVEADRTDGWGWLLGAAWEKPEIAARVALTYYSAIDHDFDKVHETGIYIGGPLAGQPYDVTTQTTVSIPQSIVLEFQSGVVEDTLVFGSIQWTNWSGDYKIAPEQYALVTGGSVLDDYENDSWTYNLGVGRRFNENWSGAVTAGYEPSDGSYRRNLGPRDGYTRVGLAATYTVGRVEVTGGVSHFWIGDTQTKVASVAPATSFTDNTAWAAGLRVGYRF
jgi:long-chain fatty acid transport protein